MGHTWVQIYLKKFNTHMAKNTKALYQIFFFCFVQNTAFSGLYAASCNLLRIFDIILVFIAYLFFRAKVPKTSWSFKSVVWPRGG